MRRIFPLVRTTSEFMFISHESGHCQKEAWLRRLQSTILRTKLTWPPIAYKLVFVVCVLSNHLVGTQTRGLGPYTTNRDIPTLGAGGETAGIWA